MSTTTAPPSTRLLTTADVCRRCAIGKSTLYSWRRAGINGVRLPVVRLGKQVRFREADLERFLESNAARGSCR